MAEPSAGPEDRPLLCPKCGTANPPEVAACLYCGETLAPRVGPRPVALGPRLIVSLAAGLLVLWIATAVSFQQYRASAEYLFQRYTLRYLLNTEDAVETYRREHHALPKTLGDLSPISGVARDASRGPVDRWFHPLHYQIEGDRYQIVSYGRDGKPGGIGLDFDLSGDQVTKDRRNSTIIFRLPPQSRATFWQFLTANGLQWGGSGGMMALTDVLTGLVAFVLAFQVLGRAARDPRGSVSIALELIVGLGATLVLGFIITLVHVPSGH
jgi:hypothetical protein